MFLKFVSRRMLLLIMVVLFGFETNLHAVILPKKLHYIWMGAKIPAKYLGNIAAFASTNPDYEIKVWTDQPESFSEISGSVKIERLDPLFDALPLPLREYLYHEIQAPGYADTRVKLFPNYAAASDILRIEALKLEGGIYLDTDISIRDIGAQDLVQEEKSVSSREGLKPGQFGEIEAPLGYVVPIDGDCAGKWNYNNYMMGATQGHPVLIEVENQIMKEYDDSLKEPHLAQEYTFSGSSCGLKKEGIFVEIEATLHRDNFWLVKLGKSSSPLRYLLTHTITGFSLFFSVFKDDLVLRKYYEKFIEPNKKVESDYLFSLIQFPTVKNIYHDNKILWWRNPTQYENQSDSDDSKVSIFGGGFLRDAIERGDVNQTQELMKAGLDSIEFEKGELTPLLVAAYLGKTDIVRLLLDLGVNVDKIGKLAFTPLFAAGCNGHTNVVQVLLEHKANVNALDIPLRRTPLHWAAKEGHVDIVRLLINNNANIDARDSLNKTPLDLATESVQAEKLEQIKRLFSISQ